MTPLPGERPPAPQPDCALGLAPHTAFFRGGDYQPWRCGMCDAVLGWTLEDATR